MDAYKVKKYFMVSGQSINDVTPLRFLKYLKVCQDEVIKFQNINPIRYFFY